LFLLSFFAFSAAYFSCFNEMKMQLGDVHKRRPQSEGVRQKGEDSSDVDVHTFSCKKQFGLFEIYSVFGWTKWEGR